MIYYEVKVDYQRQTGEDNPGKVKETYLVEGITMTDVEERVMEEIGPMVFGGDAPEFKSCRKIQFADVFPDPNAEYWYKGRVEMITIDGEKETRRPVNMLIEANTILDAVKSLRDHLSGLDCEILSVTKTKIADLLRAVN